MVPRAPSTTRMRSAASRFSKSRAPVWDAVGISGCFLCRGAQAQQMANRINKIGAVHRVEVKVGDAALDQIEHLFGGDGGRDQLSCRHVVIQPLETIGQPARDTRSGALGEILHLLEVL